MYACTDVISVSHSSSSSSRVCDHRAFFLLSLRRPSRMKNRHGLCLGVLLWIVTVTVVCWMLTGRNGGPTLTTHTRASHAHTTNLTELPCVADDTPVGCMYASIYYAFMHLCIHDAQKGRSREMISGGITEHNNERKKNVSLLNDVFSRCTYGICIQQTVVPVLVAFVCSCFRFQFLQRGAGY